MLFRIRGSRSRVVYYNKCFVDSFGDSPDAGICHWKKVERTSYEKEVFMPGGNYKKERKDKEGVYSRCWRKKISKRSC